MYIYIHKYIYIYIYIYTHNTPFANNYFGPIHRHGSTHCSAASGNLIICRAQDVAYESYHKHTIIKSSVFPCKYRAMHNTLITLKHCRRAATESCKNTA